MKKIRRKANEIPAALKHIEGMDVKAVLRKRGIFTQQRENRRLKEAAKPLAEHIIKKRKGKSKSQELQKYNSYTNEQVDSYWKKQIHSVEIIEQHFERAIKNFLVNKVLNDTLANLQSIIDKHTTEKAQTKALKDLTKQIFDASEEGDLLNQAQIDFEPLLQNMAVIAGQDAHKLIGINDPYIPSSQLRKRIQDNVEKFTHSMLDTDQKHLIDLIEAGIKNGDSVQQISSIIKNDFSEYSSMQSDRITRTEVLRSANQSALDAFRQSGVVEGKQWVTAGASDECSDYEGQVETLDGNFYGDTSEFADGDPPLHPNCKCILIPIVQGVADPGADDFGSASMQPKVDDKKHIKELEAQIDKRTKAFKKIKADRADDKVYIKALEKFIDGQE